MSVQQANKITIYTLAFVIFIDVLTVGLVFPIFAVLFNDPQGIIAPGTSVATRNLLYSMIISLPMFALLFGAPILGELSDRWGRKSVLLISLLGVFISCVLSVLSLYLGSILILFISRILVALMDGSQAIAQAAIVDISGPDDKIKNMSLITLAGTLGFIVGPILGGVLSDHNLCVWFSYETPFWAAAIIALLNFIWLKVIFQDTGPQKTHVPATWLVIFKRLAEGFFDRRYIFLSLAFIAAQFVWAGVFQASSFLLAQKFAYSGAKLGLFTAYLAATFSIGLLVILRLLLKKFTSLTLARIGMLTLAFGMVIYVLWVNRIIAIWLAIIPISLGMALVYNTLLGLFSSAVPAEEQGKVMGITVGLAAIAWLLGGFYIGHFSPISYRICFAGQGIMALLGFISLLCHRGKAMVS